MSELPSILHITFNRGIWRVTLNGAFCGDYRSRATPETALTPPRPPCALRDVWW